MAKWFCSTIFPSGLTCPNLGPNRVCLQGGFFNDCPSLIKLVHKAPPKPPTEALEIQDVMRNIEEKEYKLGGGRAVKAYYNENHITYVTQEFFEQILVPALEKQTPKKPIIDKADGITWHCPTCNNYCGYIDTLASEKTKYCYDCGQALDWSERNETNRCK